MDNYAKICLLNSGDYTKKKHAKKTDTFWWKIDGSFCAREQSRLFGQKFIYTWAAAFLLDWLTVIMQSMILLAEQPVETTSVKYLSKFYNLNVFIKNKINKKSVRWS